MPGVPTSDPRETRFRGTSLVRPSDSAWPTWLGRDGFRCRRTGYPRSPAAHSSSGTERSGTRRHLLPDSVASRFRGTAVRRYRGRGIAVRWRSGSAARHSVAAPSAVDSRRQLTRQFTRQFTTSIHSSIHDVNSLANSLANSRCQLAHQRCARGRRRIDARDSRARHRRHRPNPPRSTAVRSSTRNQ